MIRHSAPPPLPPRRGWRCADPGASHPSVAAAASGDPGASVVSPSATVGGAGGWSGASRASPSTMAAGAGVVIRRVRGPLFLPSHGGRGGGDDPGGVHGVPFRHGCGCWGRRVAMPVYGGIVYCQRSILECSFIDQ